MRRFEEEALRAAQEEGTLARVFGLTALCRDDVVDMQVSVDCENGTPAVGEYYDVEAFTRKERREDFDDP